MPAERVPFTILTGFLGAGKTTVLNRMLAGAPDRRVAVLVNELGRVAIDSKLILRRGGDVLELAGGCVCCKIDVKNDLWDGIFDVIRRSRPDHVVLETTGIAEPAAVLDDLDSARLRAAGVACVVDADAGIAQLERRDEARTQVETADRILLSKLDLAEPAGVAALHARIGELNAGAERAAFPSGAEATASLVRWLLEVRAPRARDAPSARSHRQHDHGHQLAAASYVDREPLLAAPLLAVVEQMGDRLVRVKGFVHIAGEPRRGYLELAGRRLTLRYGEPWSDAPPQSELVFIGEGVDDAMVRRRLWSCRARRAAG